MPTSVHRKRSSETPKATAAAEHEREASHSRPDAVAAEPETGRFEAGVRTSRDERTHLPAADMEGLAQDESGDRGGDAVGGTE